MLIAIAFLQAPSDPSRRHLNQRQSTATALNKDHVPLVETSPNSHKEDDDDDEKTIIIPLHSTSKYRPDAFRMTCDRAGTVEEFEMVDTIAAMISKGELKLRGEHRGLVFTLSTYASLNATRTQVLSLHENAPKIIPSFVLFCVGDSMCEECRKMHSICVADRYMEKLIQGQAGADSMALGDGPINKLYLDIIWRKPELVRILFQAGAGEVTLVDADGAWLREPPSDFGPNPSVSSENIEMETYMVDPLRCQMYPLARQSPLILNSGTVHIRSDPMGLALLDDWIASRTLRPSGYCGSDGVGGTVERSMAMLDQDGLNLLACSTNKVYSGKVKGWSSREVLLNSIHFIARENPLFSICTPWFFHATNCGGNELKYTCLEKNLQRRRDKCAGKP